MTHISRRPPREPASPHGLPGSFLVEVRPERERVFVMPRGDLDLATVDRLAAELDDLVRRGFDSLVLDLRGLTFMDSCGLRLVMAQTSRPEATVTLIDGTPAVGRLFDITGTRSSLPFEPHA